MGFFPFIFLHPARICKVRSLYYFLKVMSGPCNCLKKNKETFTRKKTRQIIRVCERSATCAMPWDRCRPEQASLPSYRKVSSYCLIPYKHNKFFFFKCVSICGHSVWFPWWTLSDWAWNWNLKIGLLHDVGYRIKIFTDIRNPNNRIMSMSMSLFCPCPWWIFFIYIF